MATGQSGLAKRPEDQLISVLNNPAIQKQIQKALPSVITPARFMRMVMTSVRRTPKLALCNQRSLLSAMLELAQLGLEPDTPLGHAWMIPYSGSVEVVVGYKGMIALADRGARVSMNAEVVYEGDDFQYALGSEPFLRHRPTEDIAKRGDLKYAYSVARFPDARPSHFKVINRADIQEAQAASQAYRSDTKKMQERSGYEPQSPWFTSTAAMWRKTAIRRHAPFLPLGAEFARAMELDETRDRGEIQVFEPFGLDPRELPAPEPDQQAKALEERLGNVPTPETPEDKTRASYLGPDEKAVGK